MAISVVCDLCKKPVLLEKARINELGKAVHEQCYVQSIRASKPVGPGERPKPSV
ncbi:MAG: hypothetical protein ACM3ND_01455 [Acidobacteriota bacterium]|jgi:hypothetical protein